MSLEVVRSQEGLVAVWVGADVASLSGVRRALVFLQPPELRVSLPALRKVTLKHSYSLIVLEEGISLLGRMV